MCSATGSVHALLRPHILHPVTDGCPCLLWLQPEPCLVCSRPSRGTVERQEPVLHLAGSSREEPGALQALPSKDEDRSSRSRVCPDAGVMGLEFWMDAWARGLVHTASRGSFPGRALLPGAHSPAAAPGGSVPVLRYPCVCVSCLGPHLGLERHQITHNDWPTQGPRSLWSTYQVPGTVGFPALASHAGK